MSFCNCSNSALSNLGTPSCQALAGVTKKIIYVPLTANDGTKNHIASSDVIDETYLIGKLNEPDKSKRWYITKDTIENVEDTKDDSVFETLNSGQNIFIQEGIRTFTGFYIKETTTFLSKIKSGACGTLGVYMLDENNNLTGSISNDGTKLYPILVDNETFDAILEKSTDSTVQKIKVTFAFSRLQKDEDLRQIYSSEIPADILGANGLLDAYLSEVTNITATSVDTVVTLDYGSAFGKQKVLGLTDTDFTLYNNTTDSTIVVNSVTENTDGEYTVGFVAQTAADSITLSASKNGFEFNSKSFTAV